VLSSALLVPVAQVQAAVAQLAVVEGGLFPALAGEAADAGELLALVLALLDLAEKRIGGLPVLVEVGVELCCTNLPMNSRIVGPPGPMWFDPSLVLVCDSNTGSITRTRHRGDDGLADVGSVEVLLVEWLRSVSTSASRKAAEVRAAHRRVLAVDERKYSSP
jgi:hypothetical protein